jgi:hypothetical protein
VTIPKLFHFFTKAADLNKPLDKRGYKGTFPTCHDFNLPTRSVEFLELIIGFSAGQIQLIDPIGHELNKLYNEEVSEFQPQTVTRNAYDMKNALELAKTAVEICCIL